MSKLFLYYSDTGNGDVLAARMRELGADVFRVEPKKELPKSFFWKIMTGGFEATVKYKPKLKGELPDTSAYDSVIIGSPVWNGRLSAPINTVLANENAAAKISDFILYSGSGEAKKATEYIKKRFPNARIVILKEPKKYPEKLEKADL